MKLEENGQQSSKAATRKRTMVGDLLETGGKIRLWNKYLADVIKCSLIKLWKCRVRFF